MQFFRYLRTALESVSGDARGPGFAFQPPPELVVDVDHDPLPPGPAEQPGLGVGIDLHTAVVIEVVARQIGQHGAIEAGAVAAALRAPERRALPRTGGRALLQ